MDHNSYLFPKLVFGTSCLGNLFEELSYDTKKSIIQTIISEYSLRRNNDGRCLNQICFDCAGKYGGYCASILLM